MVTLSPRDKCWEMRLGWWLMIRKMERAGTRKMISVINIIKRTILPCLMGILGKWHVCWWRCSWMTNRDLENVPISDVTPFPVSIRRGTTSCRSESSYFPCTRRSPSSLPLPALPSDPSPAQSRKQERERERGKESFREGKVERDRERERGKVRGKELFREEVEREREMCEESCTEGEVEKHEYIDRR